MPRHITADRQVFKVAVELITGRQLEQLLRVVTVDPFAVLVPWLGVGIAREQLPAAHDFAGDFSLKAFGFGPADGLVGLFAVGAHAIVLGVVVLLDQEQCKAGVEGAAEIFRLHPGFIALAGHRCQDFVITVKVTLRGENIGIAGIDRVVFIQVVDDARVRDHFPRCFRVIRGRRCLLGVVGHGPLAVVVHHPCPENDRQIIRGLQAQRAVGR